MSRRTVLVFVVSALVQLGLCLLPDTMGDVLQYRLWARVLARDGLAEAYWPSHPLVTSPDRLDSPVDYPPLVPYLLAMLGRVGRGLSDTAVDVLVRLPFVAANLAIGALLFADARRRAGDRTAVLVAALYLLNPAVLFDSAYWGQADALCALLVLASVLALGRDRPEWAWTLMALAVLTKPLAYPFAPLVALVTFKRFGLARTLAAALAFLLCASVVVLPFVWIGRLPALLRSLFVQLDAMPYASVNAHNLWWLVEAGTPWLDSREKAIGPLSWEAVGLVLFGAFYAVTLLRLWRSGEERSIRLSFASVGLGFFMLATHMHENHLFGVVPLLLLVDPRSPRLRRFVVLVSTTLLANMLLHDPYLTHVFRPMAGGPLLWLPQQPAVGPAFFDYYVGHGYGHLADQIRGETSLLGLALTILDSQANVLIFVAWLWTFYRRESFDVAIAVPPPPIRWAVAIPVVAAFVAATGAAFLARAFREDRARRVSVNGSREPTPRSSRDSSVPAGRGSPRS